MLRPYLLRALRGYQVSALAVETPGRLDIVAAARILHDAIQDRSYQTETRLGGAVAQYLAWKRSSASARTLVIYEGYLARLCISLAHDNPAVNEVSSQQLLDALADYPRGSLRLVRTAYSDFFRWARLWDHTTTNPVERLPPIPEPPMKVYDIFTALEQAKLIKAAESLPLPWIQRLRVLCFVDLGIRSEEARGLRPADFDTVQKVVVVKGKGGKERVVPFSDDTFRAFISYRNRPIPNVRMTDERGKFREARPPLDEDYIFFPYGQNKGAGVMWADPFRQMSPRGIRSWWTDKVIANAGVRYRSLHMNRHTLGTDLSTAGEDLATVQDWLGHASPDTTKIYVHNSRSRLARGRGSLDAFRKAQEG